MTPYTPSPLAQDLMEKQLLDRGLVLVDRMEGPEGDLPWVDWVRSGIVLCAAVMAGELAARLTPTHRTVIVRHFREDGRLDRAAIGVTDQAFHPPEYF